jgi:thiamine biosynthesis lipoprotein
MKRATKKVMTTKALARCATRLYGDAEAKFRCCDTEFLVRASGFRAGAAVEKARETALSLERELDAFDGKSAVARLNRDGEVKNRHVAEVVRRGEDYRDRTNGAFDVRHGNVESRLKTYIRGETDAAPDAEFEATEVSVNDDRVTVDGAVDLNGLAKGYIVDAAASVLSGPGRKGFVNGGGDMSPPYGAVAVESPHGDKPLKILDTDRYVATSGGYRRARGDVDHVYDPRSGRKGSRHDSVTVVSERDCTEADALATAVSTLPVDEAVELLDNWDGAEAFVVHGGVFHETDGFGEHVHEEGRGG